MAKLVRNFTVSGELLETLRRLILDAQQARPDPGVPRRLATQSLPGKARVLIGPRRAGKSTYVFQLIERLVAGGTSRERILYLNLFDDRLHDLRAETLAAIPEAYYSLYPDARGRDTVHCFFDEIQAVPGWEPFVDRLMRTEKCSVTITGSSAHMLSKDIATQMRGRALAWELFPFSFREFLDAKGVPADSALSSRQRSRVRHAFDEYWEAGGFPEVIGLPRDLRVRVHQEYFHAVLFRDLVERHDIPHPRAVTDLARQLMDNMASSYTINSLTGHLQAQGHRAPKTAVAQYLEWFEDAFFLFTVRLFDASFARSNANPKKVYCVDHAMVTSVASGILVNDGHLLENLVFSALRRRGAGIFYYRTRTGKEVDFVVPARRGRPRLVQVCATLADPVTRRRELAALAEAMEETGAVAATIVARDDEETIDLSGRAVAVVPAWRFLLGESAAD